jgi:hypothetical protein
MRRQVHLSFTMQFGGAVLDLVIVVNSLDLLLTPLWLYSLQFGGAVLDLAIEVLGLCSHSFSAVFVLGQTEGQCSEACSHQPSLVTAFSGLWRSLYTYLRSVVLVIAGLRGTGGITQSAGQPGHLKDTGRHVHSLQEQLALQVTTSRRTSLSLLPPSWELGCVCVCVCVCASVFFARTSVLCGLFLSTAEAASAAMEASST